jgi:hypothetical protein
MPATFKIKLDQRFRKEAKGRIERFYFDVGVLENKPHKLPITANNARKAGFKKNNKLTPSAAKAFGGLKTLAGGPARKISNKKSGFSIGEISEKVRSHLGINFYTRPWKSRQNADLVRFIRSFMRMITQGGKLSEKKRLENALQAVVRNPIVRGDYGKNTSATAKAKGFNRLMIDTGQLFRGIRAKVRLRRVS